jgi:hypothetical protein
MKNPLKNKKKQETKKNVEKTSQNQRSSHT